MIVLEIAILVSIWIGIVVFVRLNSSDAVLLETINRRLKRLEHALSEIELTDDKQHTVINDSHITHSEAGNTNVVPNETTVQNTQDEFDNESRSNQEIHISYEDDDFIIEET